MFKGKSAHNGTADGFFLTKGQVVYRRRYYTVARRSKQCPKTVKSGRTVRIVLHKHHTDAVFGNNNDERCFS